MNSNPAGKVKATRKLVFHRVAENLYRLEQSGGYYALLKRADKQFRRSLKTKDRKLAERRLSELRAQVGKLTTGGEARLSFEEVAQRWKEATGHTVKASTIKRWDSCIQNLSPFFAGMPIRNVQARHGDVPGVVKSAGWMAAFGLVSGIGGLATVISYFPHF